MSFATDRQTLATVLSEVDGVTGYAVKPGALQTGDSWAQLAGLAEPGNAPGAGPVEVSWRVVVVLPQDVTAALERFEELAVPVWEALQPEAYVSAIELATVPVPGSVALNAMQVTIIRELS